MKKCMLLSLIILNCSIIFAQKSKVSPLLADTAKSKWSKLKIVDGIMMLSTNDIIENISLSKHYSILLKALDHAGLIETFKSKGPITIFAPDNDAFKKFSTEKLDSLLRPARKYDLSYMLTYHALPGRITTKEIAKKINLNNGSVTFITISGGRLVARIDSNRNIVLIDENGGKSIISHFDIPQSNGILHTVNAVLVPKPKTI